MAIDKILQIYDEQGNLVDYDILASDVKFLPDGKDLPTKLAEMQDDIDAAGSGDGTVTGVKIGSTTYEPTDGVVDLSSPMSNKVDKNGTDSLVTAAEHTKLAGIAAGAQVNVINSISVNGTPATPVNGTVNIIVEEGSQIDPATSAPVMDGTAAVGASTKYAREDHVHPHDTSKQDALTFDNAPTANSNNPVKSSGIKTAIDNLLSNITIGQNGHWYVGSTDTGIQAQGPKGNSVADGDTFDIVNNLTDGGESDALSAEAGKTLADKAYSSSALGQGQREVTYQRPITYFDNSFCKGQRMVQSSGSRTFSQIFDNGNSATRMTSSQVFESADFGSSVTVFVPAGFSMTIRQVNLLDESNPTTAGALMGVSDNDGDNAAVDGGENGVLHTFTLARTYWAFWAKKGNNETITDQILADLTAGCYIEETVTEDMATPVIEIVDEEGAVEKAIYNNTTSGKTTLYSKDAVDAMLSVLEDNISNLYEHLANMAFWSAADKASAAPTSLGLDSNNSNNS